MGQNEEDQHEVETEEREKREHPLHLSVLFGLKAAKPQTLNICSVVTVVHFQASQTSHSVTSVWVLDKQKVPGLKLWCVVLSPIFKGALRKKFRLEL